MSDDDAGLLDAVRSWISEDPDPATQSELTELLEANDVAALRERFAAPLTFGTAGIRGPLGAGPARMNRAVVRRVSAGLAARALTEEHAAQRGAVVGRDARHGSEALAADTAAVLAGAGLRVRRFLDPVPTPLVAFAVRRSDAATGVVVTASHNPPADNGYKVYWSGGAQIVDPLDAEIASAAEAVGSLVDVPLAPEEVTDVTADVTAAYERACLALLRHPDRRALRIIYTPLHGVAGGLMRSLFVGAGFTDVHVVAEQAEPDPDFPTVAFPNPEEPGALDLALALAQHVAADLVVANDPDGDRIAAAVPDEGGWRPLSGDEIGCLLAESLLARGEGGPERAVATTVVSSQLLARIAEHHGVRYAETLTGFKWLATAAARAEAEGGRMVLAYEQALGVMCGDAVRDKDGMSAALLLAELAAVRRAAGSSLLEALDELAVRHGLHLTQGRSLRLDDAPPGFAQDALARLRSAPPADVAGVAVRAVEDRLEGVRRSTDGTEIALDTPPTDLVGLVLADGSRLQARPSGTEPLLKLYIEVVEPVAAGDVGAARTRARERLTRLGEAFEQLIRASRRRGA